MNPLVRLLDQERKRLKLTKGSARRPQWAGEHLRPEDLHRLRSDIKLSTVTKIADALGAALELHRVDHDVDDARAAHLVGRLSRRNLAEQIAARSHVDAGDVEHVLANLELTPTERLSRSLSRGRLKRHRR